MHICIVHAYVCSGRSIGELSAHARHARLPQCSARVPSVCHRRAADTFHRRVGSSSCGNSEARQGLLLRLANLHSTVRIRTCLFVYHCAIQVELAIQRSLTIRTYCKLTYSNVHKYSYCTCVYYRLQYSKIDTSI